MCNGCCLGSHDNKDNLLDYNFTSVVFFNNLRWIDSVNRGNRAVSVHDTCAGDFLGRSAAIRDNGGSSSVHDDDGKGGFKLPSLRVAKLQSADMKMGS